MWASKLFGSLVMLLDFVNGHRLGHDQFKVVVVPPRLWQRRGSPRYYLIYRIDTPNQALVGVAAAAEGAQIEEEAAVDTAEQIISDAQHRTTGPGQDEPH